MGWLEYTVKTAKNDPSEVMRGLIASKIDQLTTILKHWDELPTAYKDSYMSKEKLEQRLNDWKIVYSELKKGE